MTEEELAIFICKDCGDNTWVHNEYYMVHDTVWAAAGMGKHDKGMLCLGCLEGRIGRNLGPDDFTDALINHLTFRMSRRFLHRMGLGPDPMEPWKKTSKT